ncbi:ferredoxin-NADP reductase [Branchiibius hedensis]|uniref:Ferredoxin-NADP reductase n=1 Tax=Branchiibius hedensis TaxID=672460 RepID=A0A2Y9C2E1_9MICO|nr:ferredoxin reductase [Branchiibius hedensis]PWJ27122.1 ferredoxin-NADP reductase [Branchiibius hedensis]SSA35933.1 Ferredoxin-NADP reductase [Branchiibius hedensis]
MVVMFLRTDGGDASPETGALARQPSGKPVRNSGDRFRQQTAEPSRWKQRAFSVVKGFTTPLLPEDFIDLVDPLKTSTVLRGRVQQVIRETEDAVTVVIQPGRTWTGHRPGQYTRIGVDINGIRLWRAYSITSGPRTDGHIAITVKALTGGAVSTYLHEHLREGQVVQMEQAEGDFVIPEDLDKPVLLLTGGSGITPAMGILRHTVGAQQDLDVVMLHSAPRPEDVIFATELHDLAQQGKLTLLERHTDTHGMLDPVELDTLVPDWRERQTFACGPAGMLEMLEAHWEREGRRDQLIVEQFRPKLVEPGEGGTVHFTELDKELECDGARPILDIGEEAGVLMPSGCRMGICYGCVLPMREGAVRDLRTGEVTQALDGDNVLVQTCISAAAGKCEIVL